MHNKLFFQALTNIAEHPYIRKRIKREYLKDIESIPVHIIPEMAEYKRTLINVLFWKPEKLF